MSTPDSLGYSAEVRLHLEVAGRILELAQIGPDSVILRTTAEIHPCEAEVVMRVDGRQRRWPVYLPDGISSQAKRVRTVAREAVS